MTRKKKLPKTQLFVEPLGKVANDAIRGYLNDIGRGSSDEIERLSERDQNGARHNLIEVDGTSLLYLIGSRKDHADLKFKIWEGTPPYNYVYEIQPEKIVLSDSDARRIKARLAELVKTRQKKSSIPPDDFDSF
jgi:hypothetical protein